MEPLERLLASVAQRPADCVPFVPLVFGAAAGLTGNSLYDYLHKPEVMAAGQLAAVDFLGSDAMFVFADNALEAEALGCGLDFSRPLYPYVTQPLLRGWSTNDKLPMLKPGHDGRLPQMLEVCQRLKTGRPEVAVVGHVIGPVTLAAQLMGMDDFIYFIADYPHAVPSLLAEASQAVLTCAKALLAAGADGIILGDPCASPSFLPADYYPAWALPEHRRIMSTLAQEACPIRWLMVTGNTTRIIPSLVQTGANVLTVDYMVSLPRTLEEFTGVLAGNLKPQLFAQVEQEEIIIESRRIINDFRQAGRGGWLSTGCEIPLETDWQALPLNLRATIRSLEQADV